MKKSTITFWVLFTLCVLGIKAQDTFSGYPMASEGAWCWFADPRAVHYENEAGTINSSYIGYIDVHGNIKATQYDFLTGQRNEVLVRSYFQPDDHNNPTFLVLPDERVLIIYSRHTDEPAFYYRVSRRPGDITSLGEEKCIKTSANTTYPSPFILSDDPTHFYLCWRGINWHPTIAKFTLPDENDDVKMEWGAYQMVQSTGARPYAKYYSNGKDKLYMTYTTGHPDNEQPNWVYFNVININAVKGADGTVTTTPTLEDIKGNRLSTIANGTFAVNKTDAYKNAYPYTVVDATSNMRDWVWQIVTDDQDRPAIAMVRITGGKDSHEYYYAKWTGTAWRLTDLANGGGRFHSSNTEYCYSGGEAIDPQNPNVMYLSIPTEGTYGKVYEIWKYTLNDNGTVMEKEQLTRNSKKNNVRPYILPNSKSSSLRLSWMYGDYYYWLVRQGYPLGYPTAIHCDYPYAETINSYVEVPIYTKDYAGKEMKASDSEAVQMPSDGVFTLNVSLSLSGSAYYGTLVASDALSYGVAQSDAMPYTIVNGTKYNSTNRLYTSDNWALNSTGTTGDNWPTQLGVFNLTMTYDGAVLTVYRNGVIDQKIEVASLKPADLKVGGYAGTLENVTVYDKCLLQDEVKYMLHKKLLDALSVPETVNTDLVLPVKLNGESVVWTSDNEEILRADGTFQFPEVETTVKLTASVQGLVREFSLLALPREIEANLLAAYDFEAENVYQDGNESRVKDISGKGRDLCLKGSAQVDGTLNLNDNRATAFSSNGYAVVPADVMDGLRSYTVLFTATPKSLTAMPRFYDFGFNSGNSLFFRANSLAAGIKYNGGTTTMVEGSLALQAGKTYKLAVTFDARQGVTTIYADGVKVGSGTANVNEAYMLAAQQTSERNYIGRTQWWDTSFASSNGDYVGTLDNFEMYNIALTQEEIMVRQGIRSEDESLNIDCSDKIRNRDFEGLYAVKSGTGVTSDRALYEPESWTLDYSNGNEYDITVLNSSCLQGSLFSAIPTTSGGGKNAYLVRHNWGASAICLRQDVAVLPAGYYRLGAEMWLTGGGGSGSVWAQPSSKTKTSGTVSAGVSEWQYANALFSCDGTLSVTLGVEAAHTTNGTVQFTGFDNLTLYDVTANRSEEELAELLTEMETAADRLLAGTLVNEDARKSLDEANEGAKVLNAMSSYTELYAAYGLLREAIDAAQDPNATVITELKEDGKDATLPVYDLTGRLLYPSMNTRLLNTLPSGVYIYGHTKVVVK